MNRYAVAVFCVAISSLNLNAWQEKPVATYQAGIDQITEGRVTATISFLASDELAGRETNSNEFNIASRYVASRFLGAGLVGGAADGSFFHETKVKMIRVSSEEIQFTDGDSKPIAHLGLVYGAANPWSFQGGVRRLDEKAELPKESLIGVVAIKFDSEPNTNPLRKAARLVSALRQAGAQAVLLAVPADHEMIAMARRAREYALTESQRIVFEIPTLLIPESSMDQKSIQLSVPPNVVTESTMKNTIGLLKGSDPELSKEAVLFSAHLDHLGVHPGTGDRIYNGADDDATGVTGVLMLADAFSVLPKPKRSILFMTFWGEESGLLGSKQFVKTPSWPLDKIVANVNLEMLGRPEGGAYGKVWMTGWTESNLGKLMHDAAKPFGVDIFEHPQFSAKLYRASDNYSFVEKGVVAHSFSAGSLHSDYHQPDDEWERLEIPHMTKVIQGLFVGSLPLVNGEVTPKK